MTIIDRKLVRKFNTVADADTLIATYKDRSDIAAARVEEYDEGVKVCTRSFSWAASSALVYYLPSILTLPVAAAALTPALAAAGGAIAALGLWAGLSKSWTAIKPARGDVEKYEESKTVSASNPLELPAVCAYCGGEQNGGCGCGASSRIASRRMSVS